MNKVVIGSLVLLVIVVAWIGLPLIFRNIPTRVEPLNKVTTGQLKTFTMEAFQWGFNPDTIEVNKGDRVQLRVKSTDVMHGIAIPQFGVNEQLPPGKEVTIEFTADKTGTFPFVCSVYCGQGHGSMTGRLVVK